MESHQQKSSSLLNIFTKPILDPVIPGSKPIFPEFLSLRDPTSDSQERSDTNAMATALPNNPSSHEPLDLPKPILSNFHIKAKSEEISKIVTQEVHPYNVDIRSPHSTESKTTLHTPSSRPNTNPLVDIQVPCNSASNSIDCQLCHELTKRVEYLERENLNLKLKLEMPISTNGTFIWRISEVSEKRKNLPDGYLESAVFYTSLFGYKLQGCVYLNGDKKEAGKSISVYLIILRGDYDTILEWPFLFPVSIILLDQSMQGLDIGKTFQPTASSACFTQPFDDIKRPSGLQKFFPLSSLKSPYKNDDVMFIKFMVHAPSV